MSTGTIGQMIIGMSLETGKLKSGLKETEKSVEGFASKVGGLKSVAGSIAGVFAGVEIGRTMLDAAKSSAVLIDSTSDAAARLGVTVSELSQLRYAAQLSGVETETLDGALAKMSVTLGKMDEDSADASVSLRRLGLTAKDLEGKSPTERLTALADGFQKLPTFADQSAVAVAMFGKQGQSLLPFLIQGAKGIDELRAEADRLGITISGSAAQNIGSMNDALDKAKAGLQGVTNQITSASAPAVTLLATKFLDLQNALGGAKGMATVIAPLLGPLGMLAGPNLSMPTPEVADAGKGDEAAKKKADDQIKLEVRAEELTKKLREQIATYGKSTEAVEAWKLSQQGASPVMLEAVDGLMKQKKALDEQKKAMDDLKGFAKSTAESLKTPYEQLRESLDKLAEAKRKGFILDGQYFKSVQRLKDSFGQTSRAMIAASGTPMQKFESRMAELQKQAESGEINEEAYKAGAKAAEKELEGARKALLTEDKTPKGRYLARMKELEEGLKDKSISQGDFQDEHKRALRDYHNEDSKPQFSGATSAFSAEGRSQFLKWSSMGVNGGDDPWKPSTAPGQNTGWKDAQKDKGIGEVLGKVVENGWLRVKMDDKQLMQLKPDNRKEPEWDF